MNRHTSRYPAFIMAGLFLLTTQFGHVCLWDYDTLAMERRRFPEALKLITGKFLRHSDAYYEWRVEDRLRRIERAPDG